MNDQRSTIHCEEDLYRLWEERAVVGASWICTGGERVTVISPGRRNPSAGPDYLGGVLLIDGRLSAGEIEMHMKEADWFSHGHQADSSYNTVVLHLLAVSDGNCRLRIPTISAASLSEAVLAAEGTSDGESGGDNGKAGLLADLSWSRFLRRVTEILRSEQELRDADRMRRAFLRRMYDGLGYSLNRAGMMRVASALLEREADLPGLSFDETAQLVFRSSGARPTVLADIGRAFMGERRLLWILGDDLPGNDNPLRGDWRYDTRPANLPERRLWGAAKLTFDLYHNALLRELMKALMSDRGFEKAMLRLMPRFGNETFIGAERARELIVNGLLPVALAGGILAGHRRLIEISCLSYRNAPSLCSNRIVRQVEARFLRGRRLQGAFWQQGAIEYHRRFLALDRRGESMVAEPATPMYRIPGTRLIRYDGRSQRHDNNTSNDYING